MNIVNCTDRLPTKVGPYQVIVKPADSPYHKGISEGVRWSEGFSWEGTTDKVVAWADPFTPVTQPGAPIAVAIPVQVAEES